MLFVSMLNVIPGRSRDAVKLCKYPNLPPGVKIQRMLGMFGKPDMIIIFEADNETAAAEFAMQFGTCCDCTTSLATDVDNLKWIQL